MNGIEQTVAAARGEAGARALKAVSDHGQEVGGALIRGYLESYFKAHAALYGWAATFELVRQFANGSWVPPIGERAKLVYVAPAAVKERESIPA